MEKEKPQKRTQAQARREAESRRITEQLDAAKRYWLETVQPYIAERKLHGAELTLAYDAFFRLKDAAKDAGRWNDSEDGKLVPIATDLFPDWNDELFREPIPLYRDDVAAVDLATLAGALLPKPRELEPKRSEQPRQELVQDAMAQAQELLLAAQTHVARLPLRPPEGFDSPRTQGRSRKVTFREVARFTGLPLLPKLKQPREKAQPGPITVRAIQKAYVVWLESHSGIHWTTEDDYRAGRIVVADLCEMRWQRFVSASTKQRDRALRAWQEQREERDFSSSQRAS